MGKASQELATKSSSTSPSQSLSMPSQGSLFGGAGVMTQLP
jgi:hypothetical protein